MMGAGTSKNFDAAFFKKYATSEYYLNRGAYGHVYGPILWNDMQLAIKQSTFATGKVTEELKQKIEAMRDIWASIEHRHLLRIHFVDLSQLPKSMSIVMEFAAGGSLHHALRSLGGSGEKLPLDIVINWAKQIAEGMLYLHEKNIVHRDLKSSNILLMEPFDICKPHTKMTLKIADFDEVRDHDHTTTMSLAGTVAYMAPEVITEQRFSKGSDVWSYGVVIWEMLTGDTPHKGLASLAFIHKAIAGELDNFKIEESFPLFWKQLLNRCLEPSKEQRASFHDVVSIIQDKLKEKYNSDPVLIHSIETKVAVGTNIWIYSRPTGLAILDNELFVVTDNSSDIEGAVTSSSYIEVYDAIELSFSRRMHLKELIYPRDLISCNRSKCLYILQQEEILRVDSFAKLIKKWSIGNCYGNSVSITDESNVIVSDSFCCVLKEYSPDGQLIRKINLPVDEGIQYIRHAVKLSNGDFLFSCGFYYEELHRVCIVNAVGKLMRSFGGKCGSNNKRVKSPVYLSVDENGFVLVADQHNKRVLLLDSNLRFQREIISQEKRELIRPSRIILDESNGRMLVADMSETLVFQIKE